MHAVAAVGAGAVRCKMFTAVLPTGPASGFIITSDAAGKAGGLPVASVSTQAGLPGSICASLILSGEPLLGSIVAMFVAKTVELY